MIINKNETITSFQLFFYLVVAQLNVGILILPMLVYKDGKHDGWISVLVSGLFAICIIYFYSFLLRRFPNSTIFEICIIFFGKWIGRLLIISYILYFVFTGFLINQFYLISFSKWIFTNTPSWSILLLLIIVGVYLGKENIRTITRFFQLAFWIVFIIFIFSIDAYQSVDWKYLLPIGAASSADILKGSYHSIFISSGFESLLVVYPFVKDRHNKKIGSAIFSILFVTLINLFIVILCIVFFSSKEMKLIPEPTIYLYKTLTFFKELERLDLLFLSLWFVLIASSYVVYLNLANVGISILLKLKKNKSLPILVMSLIIFISGNFLPVTKTFMDTLLKYFSIASFIFVMAIPLLTLCISLLFKIKRKEVELS